MNFLNSRKLIIFISLFSLLSKKIYSLPTKLTKNIGYLYFSNNDLVDIIKDIVITKNIQNIEYLIDDFKELKELIKTNEIPKQTKEIKNRIINQIFNDYLFYFKQVDTKSLEYQINFMLAFTSEIKKNIDKRNNLFLTLSRSLSICHKNVYNKDDFNIHNAYIISVGLKYKSLLYLLEQSNLLSKEEAFQLRKAIKSTNTDQSQDKITYCIKKLNSLYSKNNT